jgi:formyl-CoA transferase
MLPLDDIKVIELCQVAAGPFCGLLLADMGADVIKIENPDGGDAMRQWPPLSDGYSENFASLNRNKRSVALDLKSLHDASLARKLILSADVIVENFRPGVLEKLGLGYRTLANQHPSLVYCSISAFGQTGPRSKEGGFDLTIQAIGGVMSVTGEPGRPPIKCGVPISDFASGLYGAYAILSALHDVRRGNPGKHIDIPMFGATLGIAALQTSEYFGSGRDPVQLGSAHPRNAPYQAFQGRDGFFAMAAGNDRLWRSVVDTVGCTDLLDDPRFTTTADRAANQVVLKELLEHKFKQHDVEYWLMTLTRAGVPCAPIKSYSQALEDPQTQHMGWVQELKLPSGKSTRTFASPVIMSGVRPTIRRPPPALGEHTFEILSEITR